MASQSDVINWILTNQDRFDVEVTDLGWISAYFPGMYELEVALCIDGKRVIGRGSAVSEDMALSIATCEAIERHLCAMYGLASTGVAGHFDEALAKENAALELIERHALSHHFNKNISLKELATEEKNNVDVPSGFRLRTFKTIAINGKYTYVQLAEGVSNFVKAGGIIGLSCAESPVRARQKALVECLRNLTAFRNSPPAPLCKEKFDTITAPTAEDRRALLFDYTYCKGLLTKLTSGAPLRNDAIELKFSYSELVKPEVLQDCPLKFFRALSDEAAPYLEFVG